MEPLETFNEILMKNNKKKILAISGSTRRNSSNEFILNFIAERYGDTMDLELYAGIDLLPHFNPDLDQADVPPVVEEFRDKISAADGVLFCTPEYVFSLPGSLKNAIEWTVSTTVFTDKPTAYIIASASGEAAFASLDLILTTLQARIGQNSRLLIQGVKGKVGKSGLITDQGTLNELDRVAKSLLDTMLRHS